MNRRDVILGGALAPMALGAAIADPLDVAAIDHARIVKAADRDLGEALKRQDYIALWKRLDPDPTEAEIVRNYPLRQPVLWVDA